MKLQHNKDRLLEAVTFAPCAPYMFFHKCCINMDNTVLRGLEQPLKAGALDSIKLEKKRDSEGAHMDERKSEPENTDRKVNTTSKLCWITKLHVDVLFGLSAKCTLKTGHLVNGDKHTRTATQRRCPRRAALLLTVTSWSWVTSPQTSSLISS